MFSWLESLDIQSVFASFAEAGSELRFVGGCVRDSLLGKEVADLDAATPLPPEQVIELFGQTNSMADFKVIPTGLKHGTVTLVGDAVKIEITTLRADKETDGRHATVAFSDSWEEDAARRDFTFNALYVDQNKKVYDYYKGQEALKAGHVVFIGDAKQRIQEDYLRILRFFRFWGRYGQGTPDAAALAACYDLAPAIKDLSKERIRDELFKILASPSAVDVISLMHPDILTHINRGPWRVDHFKDVAKAEEILGLSSDPVRGMAALLDESSRTLQSWFALSNKQADRLDAIAADKMAGWQGKSKEEVLYKLSKTRLHDFAVFQCAHQPDLAESLTDLLKLSKEWQQPVFPVSGHDLRAIGLSGPDLGKSLKNLEAQWIKDHFQPTKAQLLGMLPPY